MCADSSTNTNGTKKATDTTTEIATNRVNWPRIQFREKVSPSSKHSKHLI